MKKLFFILFPIVIAIFVACSNDDRVESPIQTDNTVLMSDVQHTDSLILKLKAINEDFINAKSHTSETRGAIRDFFRAIAIAVADAKGFIAGLKVGLSVLGWVGGVVGGIIGAAVYSTLAGIQFRAPAFDESTSVNRTHIELVVGNVRKDTELQHKMLQACSDVQINFPEKFSEVRKVGIYHNSALLSISENSQMNYDELKRLYSKEEMDLLSSECFNQMFDELENDSNLPFSRTPQLGEDLSRADEVIDVFLKGFSTFPENMNDVNDLVNSYIEEIEKDSTISMDEKVVIYSTFSTAAYSASFWNRLYNGGDFYHPHES